MAAPAMMPPFPLAVMASMSSIRFMMVSVAGCFTCFFLTGVTRSPSSCTTCCMSASLFLARPAINLYPVLLTTFTFVCWELATAAVEPWDGLVR